MSLPVFLHLFTYATVLIGVVGVAVKSYKQWTMPLHLRWEVYPVPKEGKRAEHGGSYFEDLDWWTKQRHHSLMGELRAMIPEMVLLKALWENNRKLWFWSFPFHFGLYLLMGATSLVIVGALIGVLASAPPAAVIAFLAGLAGVLGVAGLVLGSVGALGLLARRLFNQEFDGYTAFRDVFNLALFLVAFGSAWFALVFGPAGVGGLMGYIGNLLTGRVAAPVGGPALALTVGLFSFLIAYVPVSHMSHFFIKYFTYHKVRWEDAPNLPGSKMEKAILKAVNYPVSWSAAHINADGKKTWADVATEEMPKK